jgi:predicted acetyltransferase
MKNRISILPKHRFQEMIAFANNQFFKNENFGFEEFQPKVYLNSEDARNHYIYELDEEIVGLVGIYPTDFLGLKMMGVGTVCVDPEYRNQGIMSSMFRFLEKEVEPNYDLAFLSGDKFRYQNYGYYKTGRYFSFQFNLRSFSGKDYSNLNFKKYDLQNTETDNLLHKLYQKDGNPIGRKSESYFQILKTHFSEIHLLEEDGYLIYNPYTKTIREIVSRNKAIPEIIYNFMYKMNLKDISYEVSFDNPNLKILEEIAADYRVEVLLNFKVLNYPKVVKQILKNRQNLMQGKLSILIVSKKILLIEIGDDVNVVFTEDFENVDLKLTSKEMHQLLFGDYLSFHPNPVKQELITNWFPFALPVTLKSIDSF